MAVPEHNQQLARLFRSIAELLAAQRANPYRIRAYRRGADALLALEEDVADVAQRNALEDIDGIGNDLSEKIKEFLRTGKILTLETLRMPLPDHVKGWTRLPGLSDSLVAYLFSRLNIATLEDLERLVRSHMLRTMPGFSGSEETLLQAIEELRRRSS
ncbi:MAG TPA: histidinol-phosphatase [Nitrospira sp.]|jgi:DNA polymerase (family X)|nr:histidinol-phosphatase [Nitrospira sp.]